MSLAAVAAVLFGVVPTVALLFSAILAIGVLHVEPERRATALVDVAQSQFPTMLADTPAATARALLALLGHQYAGTQKASSTARTGVPYGPARFFA